MAGSLKRKYIALLIAIILFLGSCSLNDTQSPQSIAPGPENSAFSGLGFSFVLPEEYENVQYNLIDGSVAEAVFWKDGRQYTFRMAEGSRDTTDIEIGYTKAPDGTNMQSTALAGSIPINYNPGEPGLAEWQAGGCSYSLYTDKCDDKLMPSLIFDLMQEIQEQMNPPSADNAYIKLWAVDLGQEGYTRTGASYFCSWQSENKGCSMTYSVCPEVYMPVGADAEKVPFEGRDFYTAYHEMCWDGVDDNGKWIGGTTYSKGLVWYSGGCAYSLAASTGDKGISLDMISPQTALAFEGSDAYQPAGLEQTYKGWAVELRSGELIVTVRVYPKPFDGKILGDINQEGKHSLREEDGFEYYESSSSERKPDDPNFKSLIWETNEGLVQLTGGIPYSYRNEFPSDVWDFIDAGLAMSITEQIGCVPEQFPR